MDELEIKNETKIQTWNQRVPDCWIYVQDAGVKLGRIQIFNNWSPYMVLDFEKKMWIGLEYFCEEGDEFWNMTSKAWAEFGAQELCKMGILTRGSKTLKFHCEKVKKAYPAYFDTYQEIDQLIAWLNQFQNLYCIGRNGQHRYNNRDHSMLTAMEAVSCMLTGKKEKAGIWKINAEKEYHETVSKSQEERK